QTTPDELFRILSDMIDPLHDAHTSISARAIQKRFHGYRPSADPMQRKNAARITEIIETKYIRGGLPDFCNKQVQFGLLKTPPGSGTIGYLRIHSLSNSSRDQEFLKQLHALQSALDRIFQGYP